MTSILKVKSNVYTQISLIIYINRTGQASEEEPLGTISPKATSFRNLKKKKIDVWAQ